MSDNANFRVTDIILPREHFIRMERQLVAAERLYEAARSVGWAYGFDRERAELEQALTDYANAKGEK